MARRDHDAMMQPLRAARQTVWALRSGEADARTAADALMRIARAMEYVLRRRLRDDEAAELEVRLSALAPDEMDAERVLGELRRRDRVSLELAAGYHEMLGLRRRLQAGTPPAARDVELAVSLADRLERELSPAAAGSGSDATVAMPPPQPSTEPGSEAAVTPRTPTRGRRRDPYGAAVVAAGLVALVLVVAAVAWLAVGRRGSTLDEGIVLFRSGAYVEAEPHFRRHAEARPDDATARLYLARIYRRQRQFDRAADELRRGLQATPDDAGLQRELGFLLLDTGRAEAAVERFRGAVGAEPESSEGWLGLIRALRESGRADAAERVITRAPQEVRALLGRTGPAAAPATPQTAPSL